MSARACVCVCVVGPVRSRSGSQAEHGLGGRSRAAAAMAMEEKSPPGDVVECAFTGDEAEQVEEGSPPGDVECAITGDEAEQVEEGPALQPCKNPSCRYAVHSAPESMNVQEGYCCNACYGHHTKQAWVGAAHYRHCEKIVIKPLEPKGDDAPANPQKKKSKKKKRKGGGALEQGGPQLGPEQEAAPEEALSRHLQLLRAEAARPHPGPGFCRLWKPDGTFEVRRIRGSHPSPEEVRTNSELESEEEPKQELESEEVRTNSELKSEEEPKQELESEEQLPRTNSRRSRPQSSRGRRTTSRRSRSRNFRGRAGDASRGEPEDERRSRSQRRRRGEPEDARRTGHGRGSTKRHGGDNAKRRGR